MKFEIHWLQALRRVTQVGVMLLMLSVPAISRYGNYVAAYDIDGRLEDWEGTLAGTALTVIDGTFRKLPGGEVERVGETVRSRDGVLPVEAEIEEAIFKFHPVYDKEARYFVDITFEGEERPWTIRLPIEIGEPSSPWTAVLLGVGGALIGFIVLRAFLIKASRRAAPAEQPVEKPA